MAALYLAGDARPYPADAPPKIDHSPKSRIRNGREMIVYGAGLVTGSAVGLAFAGRREQCGYSAEVTLTRSAPRVVGSGLLATGLC